MRTIFFLSTCALLFLSGCGKVEVTHEQPHVSVGQPTTIKARSLEELIEAGNYSNVNRFVRKHVAIKKIPETTTVELFIIDFRGPITTEAALSRMSELGLRPANTLECLSYGESFDFGSQRIVCLDNTSINGHDGNLYLTLDGNPHFWDHSYGDKVLNLFDRHGTQAYWGENSHTYKFLATTS